MKKIVAIVLLLAVLALGVGSVAAVSDPKAQPGIDTTASFNFMI